MKKLSLTALAFTMLVGATACGGGSGGSDEFSISLSQDSVPADGRDTIVITIEANPGGKAVKDGTAVTVSIDDLNTGSFKEYVPGKANTTTAKGKLVGGKTVINFYPAPLSLDATPTAVNISANMTVNKKQYTASATLTINKPTPVSAKYFDFSCNYPNIGVFTSILSNITPELKIPCKVTTKDRYGVDLPYAEVKFKAEAGRIVEVPAAGKTPRSFYFTYRDGDDQPADVLATESESEAGLSTPRPGSTSTDPHDYNPRDGLATIVAYTYGEEWLDDKNKNGKQDPGEEHWDESEPFLDINDNGTYDDDEDRPINPNHRWFADNDNNGSWSDANGVWDSGITIGHFDRILLTGEPFYSQITPNSFAMCACGSQDFNIRVMDQNFNPVATTSPNDLIEIDDFKYQYFKTVGDIGKISLSNQTYMQFGVSRSFRDADEIKFKGIITGEADGKTVLTGREWSFTIEDGQSGCDTGCPVSTSVGKYPKTCKAADANHVGEMKVTFKYTPIPTVSGVSGSKQLTKVMTVASGIITAYYLDDEGKETCIDSKNNSNN